MTPDETPTDSCDAVELASNLADELRFCEDCLDVTAHVLEGDEYRCLACPDDEVDE